MGEERRQSPRIKCRIRCRIQRERDHRSGCLLDVSEGGLCVLSPDPVSQHESLKLHIEVPDLGRISVHAIAWHVRRVRGATSGKKAWSVGAVLAKADPGYHSLLQDAVLSGASTGNEAATIGGIRADELQVFKVRVKKKLGPRTRLLSLTAKDAEEAERLATKDLDESWVIVDVKAA